LLHAAIFGAHTELYTGLSPEITKESDGSYIIPWGRVGKLSRKLQESVKLKNQGGNGAGSKYYDWCEHEVDKY
jgi:retinol dehydrogenase-12